MPHQPFLLVWQFICVSLFPPSHRRAMALYGYFNYAKKHNPVLMPLTNRQKQVLQLIADGCSNKQISQSLSISESTVENHVHHVYKKLKLSNRAQAVAYVLRTKIAVKDHDVQTRNGEAV
jgi:DNA-binding NarL/FixJ family response regulator